jgi:hypothetical protein
MMKRIQAWVRIGISGLKTHGFWLALGVGSFVVREEDESVCGDCSMLVAGARCGSGGGESLDDAADG